MTIQVLSNDNAGKNKSYEKLNSEFVEFVSIPQKLHPFKNPHRLPTEPMGIHYSPHTHTIPIPIPMGIPMGIPIPTAALQLTRRRTHQRVQKLIATKHLTPLKLFKTPAKKKSISYFTATGIIPYFNNAQTRVESQTSLDCLLSMTYRENGEKLSKRCNFPMISF